MIKLTRGIPGKCNDPESHDLAVDDVIHIWDDRGLVKVSISRGDDFLYFGKDHEITLDFPRGITVDQAWHFLDSILRMNWTLAHIFNRQGGEIRSRIYFIATSRDEMLLKLRSHDGFRRD